MLSAFFLRASNTNTITSSNLLAIRANFLPFGPFISLFQKNMPTFPQHPVPPFSAVWLDPPASAGLLLAEVFGHLRVLNCAKSSRTPKLILWICT